jgi:hypothetical protein
MDTLTRHDMAVDLLKAGIPAAEIDDAVTSAVSLASAGDISPREAVATVVQALVSFELGGPTEREEVRMSEPTGEDWELQLAAALGIEVATLAIVAPDSLVALPPTAFDLPEHPFSFDGSKVVVTHLILDEVGASFVSGDDGKPVPALDFPDRPRLTTTTLHDLPAGWRVVSDQVLTEATPRYDFVQDPSYRLSPPTSE